MIQMEIMQIGLMYKAIVGKELTPYLDEMQ